MHCIPYFLLRVDRMMAAIERAKELGTYQADDRSQQYPLHDQKLVHKAINECWTKVHQLEAAGKKKDEEISSLKKQLRNYRIANTALISIITGLAWEGLKALFTLIR